MAAWEIEASLGDEVGPLAELNQSARKTIDEWLISTVPTTSCADRVERFPQAHCPGLQGQPGQPARV